MKNSKMADKMKMAAKMKMAEKKPMTSKSVTKKVTVKTTKK
jgi:hypothetical protein